MKCITPIFDSIIIYLLTGDKLFNSNKFLVLLLNDVINGSIVYGVVGKNVYIKKSHGKNVHEKMFI